MQPAFPVPLPHRCHLPQHEAKLHVHVQTGFHRKWTQLHRYLLLQADMSNTLHVHGSILQCVCVVDIDECEDLSACPNAKFECKNKPGSVDCFCRYQKTKDTDGCGTFTTVRVQIKAKQTDTSKP